jgi:hypothetical protein
MRAVYGPSGLGLSLWQIINPQNGEEQVHKGLYTHQKGKTASHRLWLRRVPRGMRGRHHLTRAMYRPSGLRLCLFQIINPQTGEKQVHRVLYTHQKATRTQIESASTAYFIAVIDHFLLKSSGLFG